MPSSFQKLAAKKKQKALPAPPKPTAVKESLSDPEIGFQAEPPRREIIRDTFAFPQEEYELIQQMIERCWRMGHSPFRSEVARAALRTLSALKDEDLSTAIKGVERLKRGPGRKG